MYFSGKLSIDPSQLTNLEIVKPTHAFGRMLHFVSAGRTSPKEEHETFTAVSILQQINRSFRELGITNVVRLAKDDIDFYFDEEGKEDDLREALDAFDLEVAGLEAELFKTLTLTVEADQEGMKYLIEVSVKRCHPVGEFPITINMNAVPTDFQKQPGETQDQLRERMAGTLPTREAYQQYVVSRRATFDQFLNQLDFSIRKFLKVDETKVEGRARIVRPKKRSRQTQVTPPHDRHSSEPVFHGYYGFGDAFLFSMLWSDFVHDHHYPVQNVDIVDDNGEEMMSVGENGFDAGESDTLNSEADFEAPPEGDIELHSGHAFDSEFEASGMMAEADDTDLKSVGVADSGGGWLSDTFGGFDGGGDDSGSSCGSSCGGGCGGD